jgi:predicted DsbA family dithiol-disulfide isomerase
MKLYVEPMDATLVEVDADGRVRFEQEGWTTPTLQEQRAILYAAQNEVADLTELIEKLQEGRKP